MNTLRVKIAILLAVVIVSVVGVLTGVLLYLFRPPGTHYTMGPVAEQIVMLSTAVSGQDGGAKEKVALSPDPAPGRPSRRFTEWLNETLRERGSLLTATVSRENQDAPMFASVRIGNRGYLQIPIPDLPPPDGGWHVLLRWLLLITFGATAVAIFFANRMVQPLVLLQKTVASVGPDANIPMLPVEGPAEVRATAEAVNSLSSRLKSAIESRMRLVAAAGHDLRTPITRMRLRAEFVSDDDDRAMWFKDIDELERIADSAIQLVREESDNTLHETFRLDALVQEIVEELQSLDLDIVLESYSIVPAEIRASRTAMSRALRNLIINSATHGVRSRVRMSQNEKDTVRLIIEDDGPGIPAELLGQVFEPFFRVDPARRQNFAGAGLGLTIAHEIITRNNGRLTIANQNEGGLVQIAEFPVSRNENDKA